MSFLSVAQSAMHCGLLENWCRLFSPVAWRLTVQRVNGAQSSSTMWTTCALKLQKSSSLDHQPDLCAHTKKLLAQSRIFSSFPPSPFVSILVWVVYVKDKEQESSRGLEKTQEVHSGAFHTLKLLLSCGKHTTQYVYTQRGHTARILLAGVNSSRETNHYKSVMIEMWNWCSALFFFFYWRSGNV